MCLAINDCPQFESFMRERIFAALVGVENLKLSIQLVLSYVRPIKEKQKSNYDFIVISFHSNLSQIKQIFQH